MARGERKRARGDASASLPHARGSDLNTRRDQRSDEAQAYRRLYKLARWRKRRAAQLAAEPLCQMCKRLGRVRAATVADHVRPHRGDADLFWNGDLQSLCAEHHDAVKQAEERRGFVVGSDINGRPLDPGHPWNRP